jgi:diguanylate cyclase (GGDEF)-like protein
MIDVDHFKKFNDQYGHQAGDGCLRSVALALAGQARRPADLAARYGGEEFAMLLPNTDQEGCRQIGEKIREALQACGVMHAQNPPSRRVTASLGGATVMSVGSEADSASLVEAADRALYAAKEGGRDKVVMSGRVIGWFETTSAWSSATGAAAADGRCN